MTGSLVNILCMKWGNAYPAAYVNLLRSAVAARLRRPHRFICLTDDASGIEAPAEAYPIPLAGLPPERARNGGWPKLAVFRAGLHGIEGPALFLDLDVLVVGALDPLFEHDPERRLLIIRDWLPRGQRLYRRRGRIGNSSVFRFAAGGQTQILARFEADPESAFSSFRNEQRFLTAHAEDLAWWPEAWCRSYKRHCRAPFPLSPLLRPRVPAGARVVAFHGWPKPHDLADPGTPAPSSARPARPVRWVTDYWRRYGGTAA